MPNNDSHHHVVKTTEQWQDRAVEYWVVPRGTLCVELTPEKKTKIKIGEGGKYYSQLPYICDGHDMSNYYTKEETDRLLDNLNRMAIQSTDVYDTKDDLPLDGNKLGDVRFVKSTSEQKVDPDVYLWNGSKWIYVGYDFANIDLDRYLTKTEFHSEFDPVKDKVDEMYPKMHTHDNKDVLDRTERPFTIADKEKLDSLENYDDTEIRELIHETGHVHWNKHILDTITEDKLWTVQDREKFESLHNYDDTELRNRMGVVESKAHTHTNKDILDQTTAPFKTDDKQKLDSLENYDIFIGTDGRYPGVKGLVPAPSALDIGTFLSSDGTWKKAGFDSDFVGATPYMDGEHGLVPAPLMGEQSYFLRGDGTWARVKNGDKYKAGEGITILSGEVISDTFPFEIFPKAATVTQYVIYGTASGVGNAVSGHYEVPVKISAEGHVDRLQTISIADPLYDGDYIDFQKQVFAHYRTNINNRCTIDPQYNYKVGIHSDGTISYHNPGAYGSKPFVSNPMEIIPGATYEITPWDTYGTRISNFQAVMYLNMYDADMNRTRTIFQEYLGNTVVVATSNEKYMRLTRMYAPEESSYGSYSVIYQLYPVETPCQLNELLLYPNVVNTVDVLTTNKPNEIYVEVEEPEDIDPDDPMSQYSGIIYNDGILDITQEDPNNLNELTVHFRDDVDKTITIPGASVMEGATASTDGEEGLVPAPLAGDENKFLRGDGTWVEVSGGGTTYVEGDAISIEHPQISSTITHVKWVLLNTRNRSSAGDIVQVGEFELYDTDDQLLTYNSISATFGNGGTPTYGTNQYQQTPDKLIDGDTSLKMCCTNFTTSCLGLEITMELMDSIDIQDIKQYRYITANDMDVRDPVTWDLYVSSDGTDWTLVDRQVDDSTIPTARETSTAYYEITHPTSDELAISVKYGNGLALDENGALTVVGGSGTEYDAGPGIEIGPSPSELYTQVEYLKSTGTQTILTDIQIGLTNKYVADIKLDTFLGYISETRSYIFGGSHYLVQFGTNSDQSYASFLLGVSWSGSYGQIAGVNGITERGTIIAKRGSSTCSWTTETYGTQTTSVGTAEYSDAGLLTIFGTSAASAYNSYEMRLYSFKIYDSTNQLVNDLVPVKRNSDDELGLYDLITHTFYTNTGTGSFTAGSEIGPVPGDNEVISAKLGYGLTFDNNDAITLDETADLVFNCDYSSE